MRLKARAAAAGPWRRPCPAATSCEPLHDLHHTEVRFSAQPGLHRKCMLRSHALSQHHSWLALARAAPYFDCLAGSNMPSAHGISSREGVLHCTCLISRTLRNSPLPGGKVHVPRPHQQLLPCLQLFRQRSEERVVQRGPRAPRGRGFGVATGRGGDRSGERGPVCGRPGGRHEAQLLCIVADRVRLHGGRCLKQCNRSSTVTHRPDVAGVPSLHMPCFHMPGVHRMIAMCSWPSELHDVLRSIHRRSMLSIYCVLPTLLLNRDST